MTIYVPSVDSTTHKFSSTILAPLDGRYRNAFLAKDNGVVGDGTTDDAAALNSLLTAAAAAGAAVQLAPGSTVRVASASITLPSNTWLDLNGATIKSALPNTSDRLLVVSNVSNVTIVNGVLDGDKASYATTTEQRHNIHIIHSANVTLRDVRSVRAKGDGIYIGDQSTGYSSDIYLQNVVCDSNHRNGMSVSHVSGLTAIGCRFINTSGTAPQCGVDIEPNVTTVVCEYLKFIGCTFSGNTASGLLVSLQALPSAHQGSIDLVGCYAFNNVLHGIELKDSTDFTMTGGSVQGNTQHGVNMRSGYGTLNSNAKFEGVTSRLNGREGFYADTNAQIVGLTINGCNFIDNSQSSSGSYHGVYLNPSASSSDVIVTGCRFNGTSQRYGLRTASTLSNVSTGLNRYGTNGTGPFLFGDDAPSRFQADAAISKTTSYTTTARNTLGATSVPVGTQVYDSTLGKPIWSTGSVWKDAAGTTV